MQRLKRPSSIANLTGLQILSLDFCQNLEFLPDSINSLSSLRKLSISCCRSLESLPILPSVSDLKPQYCTSLKKFSSSITSVEQKWDHDFYYSFREYPRNFEFFGCEMLDENAHGVDQALFRILQCANLCLKYRYEPDEEFMVGYLPMLLKICWPGNELPRWFNYKSEGCTICINLPNQADQWYNNSYLGLAFFAIVEFNGYSGDYLKIYRESFYTFPNGDLWRQARLVNTSFF